MALFYVTYLFLGILVTFTNNEGPDEILHKAALHQGLHCLLR